MNIKEDFKLKEWIYPIIIIFVLIICSFLLSNHITSLYHDRGREFMIPQAILEGNVPFIDIKLIYFPFAYYINVLIYKLLGISINSLLISQTFFCSIFILTFYALGKEFLNKTSSFLLSILVITCCIFAKNDLFSLILPYSYARAYGTISAIIEIYFLIKLYKTQNLKYLYFAALITGFCISCKFEFISMLILFFIGTILFKKLDLKQYLKIFILLTIFPIINILILFFQGVNLKNIQDAITFGINFSKTEVMKIFLANIGVYPHNFDHNFSTFIKTLPKLLLILCAIFTGFKLDYTIKKPIFIPIFTAIILYFFHSTKIINECWIILPITIAIFLIKDFRQLIKTNRTLLILLIATLCLGQREFFRLSLTYYGTFSFPLYILSSFIILNKYLPEKITNIKTQHILNYFLLLVISIYSYTLYTKRIQTDFPLRTSKGTFYTKVSYGIPLKNTLRFVEENISKNDTILILPEGNLINYFTNRKVNLQCFMMDRLYHDAYGEEKARDLIKQSNSNYIILINTPQISNFGKAPLYKNNGSLSSIYIANYYEKIAEFYNKSTEIIILKQTKKRNKIPTNFTCERKNK